MAGFWIRGSHCSLHRNKTLLPAKPCLFGFFILCILFIFAFSANSEINAVFLYLFLGCICYIMGLDGGSPRIRTMSEKMRALLMKQTRINTKWIVCIYLTSALKRRIVNVQPERTGTHPTPVCVVGAEGQDYVRC